jgi:XPB/Ssl2-like helicase family protein/WYL domain-containing protein
VVPTTLTSWLASLDPERLAEIILRRPEIGAPPAPTNLADLAERLSARLTVARTFRQLCAPAIQLIEAAQSLLTDDGAGVPLKELAALLGRTPDDDDLAATLAVLAQRALAWPDGDCIHLIGPLRNGFEKPLGLGEPLTHLLSIRPADEVRLIGHRLGRPARRRKDQIVADLAAWFADRQHVLDLYAAAPPATRMVLDAIASAQNPQLFMQTRPMPPQVQWAADRGLLVSLDLAFAEMPREVAIALRGPDWQAPFTPEPPRPALRVVEIGAVAREAAAAAAIALDQIGALLNAAPIALRKSGGVGLRELRRLASASGADEVATRLWVELAARAGLLAVADGEALPTPEYDEWLTAQPEDRLALLLHAWWELAAAPTLQQRRDAAIPAPLTRDPYGTLARDLRPVLLRCIADLAGAVADDGHGVAALVAWYAPLAARSPDDSPVVGSILHDARLLGVLARGALSPLGRALLAGDVAAAAAELLVPDTEQAVFQADLTAVAAGVPAAALADLLDGCADREARGAASVWRFSAQSVRRALDTGASPEELLDRLHEVGRLPQALEYLIGDVARRHGLLRVRAVGCVLRSTDEALLAEIAADRRLGRLGMTQLAPTILASPLAAGETLSALRAAGYAPAGEDASGAALVELAPRRRAQPMPAARRIQHDPPSPPPADPLTLANALLAAPVPSSQRGQYPLPIPRAEGPQETIVRAAPHLSPTEVELLAYALDRQVPVHIEYINAGGRPSNRVVEPVELEGYLLRAWCHLRDDERVFALARVAAVSPA